MDSRATSKTCATNESLDIVITILQLTHSEKFSVERRQLSEDIIEIIEERIAAMDPQKKQLLNSGAMLDLIERVSV